MQESMTFPLDENILALRTSIQQSLDNYQISQGVMLRGYLGQLKVDSTQLTKGSIKVILFADGKVNVDVEGL